MRLPFFLQSSVIALCAVCAAAPLAARAEDNAAPIKLKMNDHIVFLGDSITQGGGGPNGYITVFDKTITEKHKDLDLKFTNAGISGHKVPDLQGRLEKDVIDKKPTLVFIYIGIN